MPPRRSLLESELLLVLQDEVERFKSDSMAAQRFGVSRGHLSRVLREQKPITKRLAHALGYELQTIFVPYEHRD